jgi:hypothetical protein
MRTHIAKKCQKLQKTANNCKTMAEKEKKPRKVSKKHLAFIDAYFANGMNATQAYSSVFKTAKRGSCRASAHKLLTRADIQEEIRNRLAETVMGADEVLNRLSSMARASHESFVVIDADGSLHFDFNQDEAKKNLFLIKKIQTKRTRRINGKGDHKEEWEDETTTVELHDAQTALVQLGKHHHIIVDRTEVTGKDGNAIPVELFSEALDKVYGKRGTE